MRAVCAVLIALFLVLIAADLIPRAERLREALMAPERHVPEWEPER
jgi:hypothetical protein